MERCDHYCKEQGITVDNKFSTLLANIGGEAYEIIKDTFPSEMLIEKNYAEVKDKLFSSKTSEIVERYVFHLIKKSEFQSIADYVRSLKRQPTKRQYEDYVNTMMRDQFVLEVHDEATRRKLLSERKLTFNKSIETASITEHVNMI